jgi:hypothetical protein
MNRLSITMAGFAASLLVTAVSFAATQEQSQPQEDSFYSRSPHYTNRGIEYWYAEEQGGLERITGVSAAELGCL